VSKRSLLQRLLGSFPRSALHSARSTAALCHALISERGEVSGAILAKEALAAYQGLEGAALAAFFDLLAEEFSPDPVEVGRCADAYRKDPSQTNLVRLQGAVESPRQELLRRLNMASGGTATLVEMRRALLRDLGARPLWAGIEADLANALKSWFNRGFLALERIDWRTSALVLEKLIQYEAVHQIQGWDDLRRRLQADRRCYAFFHPGLPDEPLIFIEVALTKGMSARIQPLLDPESAVVDPDGADCAIFYSITNCQEGLRGVSFGNLLIKQVAEDLGREFPKLKTFATLSPVPGFRAWLADAAAPQPGRPENAELRALPGKLELQNWHEDKALAAELQPQLLRSCAYYLMHAKYDGEALDPVARFHLGNGARLERINWLGDISELGMQRAAGMMVNYVYRLSDVERNHEAYAREHQVIASSRIEKLAQESPLAQDGERR